MWRGNVEKWLPKISSIGCILDVVADGIKHVFRSVGCASIQDLHVYTCVSEVPWYLWCAG